MSKPTISDIRTEKKQTLDAWAAEVGIGSRGYASRVERSLEQPSVTISLAIELWSEQRIDAADLNTDVAAARMGCGECLHAPADTPAAGAVSGGNDAETSAPTQKEEVAA